MDNIILNGKQSKEIAKSVYDEIKNHCEANFDRFFAEYLKEREAADGQPIEPITIRFNPINHYVGNNPDENAVINDTTERGNP